MNKIKIFFFSATVLHFELVFWEIVGQFGTGQFSTGQFGTGQFGTKIIKQTIWHQDNKSGQFGIKIIKVYN